MEANGRNISELSAIALASTPRKKKAVAATVEATGEETAVSRKSSRSDLEYEKYVKELLRGKAIFMPRFEFIPDVEELEEVLKI